MKKLKALLGLLFLPILGVFIPELGGDVAVMFGSLAGVAGLVVIITQWIKKTINYRPGVGWKYLPQVISALVSVLLSIIAWWLGFGLFVELETIIQAIGLGLLVSGLSNGWYDAPFVKEWAKILFGISYTKPKNW